jgi:putative cardiolipin synthase
VASGLGGCGTLPPGADFPKTVSVALAHPEETRLGGQFAGEARAHGGNSGFRIITLGVEGFLARVQMIDAAERTLDLQYYIFRGDDTGWLVANALLRAANRGVRVRVLIDDGDTIVGDEQIIALDAHPSIEIRVFNPFVYRGHAKLLRAIEFMFNASRLDYRMHNKLLVSDNTLALIGGRNIGNQYFQMDPESQVADDDVFVAGPVAVRLSATFDEYWNSALAIPAEALRHVKQAPADSGKHRARAGKQLALASTASDDFIARIATGEPYAGLISGRLPLIWTPAKVVCDSPDKKNVENGLRAGRLMARPVAATANAVQSELLMVTPYFIPAHEELQLIKDLRQRGVRVRIVTNSLMSTGDILALAAYTNYRVPLLLDGVELYEVRSLLGNVRGSGQTVKISRHGNYGLHAKLFVFDRQEIFVGSMNFDQRSRHLNTEVGLIIDSPELAEQTAARFEAMAQPANCYAVQLQPRNAGNAPHLLWRTQENSATVEYTREPATSGWQRFTARFLALLPLDREL